MPTARSVGEIIEYHDRSVVALRVLDRHADNLVEPERARFPRRPEAFVEALEGMRNELDDEVVLAIVASAERVFRLDFTARQNDGSAPGVRFRALVERFDGRVPLEEIVDVWKDLTRASDECGAFKQMYLYRHGLAHGRYFNKSGVHHTTPRAVAGVVDDVVDVVRNYAADFPRT